ncbi:MAG: AAA family ATPase [Desulfurococcales archaeon]|nr:AAA family ATPase [Desulfurococcales archaeon]
MRTVAVHSQRGGSGKSVLAANLAYAIAKEEYRVALLDYDLRAPTQYYIFNEPRVNRFINDYLNDEAEYADVITELPVEANRGELVVAFANPSIEAIKEALVRGRRWEMNALRKLINLINKLKEAGIDLVLIDTPPGPQYSSLNAIVASDAVVLVTLPDKIEVKGAEILLREIYSLVDVRVMLIVNKVPAKTHEEAVKLSREVARRLGNVELLEAIPYYHEVVLYNGDKLMVRDLPEHPYSKLVESIARRIWTYL